jgi:serine/threonine protein kinase
MATETSTTPRVLSNDPYRHLDHLGHGSYGYVDKVCLNTDVALPPSRVYARKVIKITASGNKETILESTRNEFTILRRLKHRHVVSVLELYQCRNLLSIIMEQVADTDLAEYLQSTDNLSDNDDRKDLQKSIMATWPGCLIQALDYLHEMRVKHKDIKPANILIMSGQVLLADFGISKDLIDQQTTASLWGNIGTPLYCAPEVLLDNHRRGRATDVFSLGCVFLEISTVIVGYQGSLEQWAKHRELSGSKLYSKTPSQILQWIAYLWALYNARYKRGSKDDGDLAKGIVPADISFFMLDPNPKTRITARELFELTRIPDTSFHELIGKQSCHSCREVFCSTANTNIPRYATYRPEEEIPCPKNPQTELQHTPPSWEEAKRLWLSLYKWW